MGKPSLSDGTKVYEGEAKCNFSSQYFAGVRWSDGVQVLSTSCLFATLNITQLEITFEGLRMILGETNPNEVPLAILKR